MWILFGPQFMAHVYYLTRTYAYYVYREKQIMLGVWTGATSASKMSRKNRTETKSDETNPTLFLVNTAAGRLDGQQHPPTTHII